MYAQKQYIARWHIAYSHLQGPQAASKILHVAKNKPTLALLFIGYAITRVCDTTLEAMLSHTCCALTAFDLGIHPVLVHEEGARFRFDRDARERRRPINFMCNLEHNPSLFRKRLEGILLHSRTNMIPSAARGLKTYISPSGGESTEILTAAFMIHARAESKTRR